MSEVPMYLWLENAKEWQTAAMRGAGEERCEDALPIPLLLGGGGSHARRTTYLIRKDFNFKKIW